MALIVRSIEQGLTLVHCPVCHRVWRSSTPQAVLAAHVMYFHPVQWDRWLGRKRDLQELSRMIRLPDPR
jgi:hypothetical protein